MFTIEACDQLRGNVRAEIDLLIFETWMNEADSDHDVEILAHRGQQLQDPLDARSSHIIARNEAGKAIGYGRISFAYDSTHLCDELKFLKPKLHDFPIAYISRLVVHPQYRRQGVAAKIHEARIKLASKKGIYSIYGWAVGDKPRSALLRAGFRETTLVDGFATPWYRTTRKTRLVEFIGKSSSKTA